MPVAQDEKEQSGSTTAPVASTSTAASRLAAQRAAKAAAKASKRGTSAVPNPVAQGVSAATSWYASHGRLLWVGLAAVAVGTLAWFVIAAQLAKTGHEAAALLSKADETALAPIVAPGEDTGSDAPKESYPTAIARAEKAKAAFAAVVKGFAGSDAASWATLGEAGSLLQLGKAAEAQKLYAKLSVQENAPIGVKARAIEGLGFALEGQQKYADAAKQFEKLAPLDEGSYKTLADYHRARMLVAQGQLQKAAELLQPLIKAERARTEAQGGIRYESVLNNAEALLTELSVALGAPSLRVDIPAPSMQSPTPGPMQEGSGSGLSQEIIDSLRKQLESGKGGKGLTKELLQQLEQQAQENPPASTGAEK